ncbi:MAG: hypothetical protein ACR2GZ_00260 [Solirubrobacteraceae bacterium]
MSGHPSIAAVALTLALAGCGGSSASSSSSATVTRQATATATVTTSARSTSATSARTSAPGRTRASSRTTTTTTTTNAAPSLPAQFVIQAGGRLRPSLVAAPGHTEIQLTVRSRDGQAHRFVLDIPGPRVLKTAPGVAVGLRLVGLPNGTYPIEVDGVPRGKLIVGATPGP